MAIVSIAGTSVLAHGVAPLAVQSRDPEARTPGASARSDEAVYEGELYALFGDHPRESGLPDITIFMLHATDGRDYELDLSRATLPPEGVHSLIHQHLRIRTDARPKAISSAPGARLQLKVRDARIMAMPGSSGVMSLKSGLEKATGSNPYVSLMCKFSDVATVPPHDQSFFVAQLGNTMPGFDHYFREVSYGSLNLSGSTASASWVALPHPKSYYVDGVKSANQYLSEIFNDCTAVHDAAINFSGFYGINIMLNDTIDGAAWGGSSCKTLDGSVANKCWPATWMPYYGEGSTRFGWREQAVMAHELSHSFGAPHSDDPKPYQYGNTWDVVSNPGASCVNVDANYGCWGQHQVAYAKSVMGILSGARIASHTPGTTTSYDIERMAQPANAVGTYQMLRINITGTSTRWYTVESRYRVGYDAQLYGNGVIIHEVDTARPDTGNPNIPFDPARLVVPGNAAGVDGYGGLAAVWQPGMMFVNQADNVKIAVNSVSAGGTANVTVSPYSAVTDNFPVTCSGLPAGWSTPSSLPGSPSVPTTGWSASSDSSVAGGCSLKSNAMVDAPNDGVTRYKAAVEYTGSMGTGNITFWARDSSEPGYDCLHFYIDGSEQSTGTCSGDGGTGLTPTSSSAPDTGWRSYSFPVTAGSHTARWVYSKDYYMLGADAAWIDSVVFPVATSADLSITNASSVNPASSGRDDVFTMTAMNNGPSSAAGVAVNASYDPTAMVIWASPGCVKQGASAMYSCDGGTLANGSSVTFKLVLRRDTAGTISNGASVTASTSDPSIANNTANVSLSMVASPAASQILRYRLYSDVTKEHLFTTDLNEYNVLGTSGWSQEGTVGHVLDNPGSFNGVTATPYYRLYNSTTHWHHWTTDPNEYYTLVQFSNWNGEGVDGWILPTAAPGSTQLYRLLYPFVAGLHHWTIDPNEYNTLIATYGWQGEGGSGYVIP